MYYVHLNSKLKLTKGACLARVISTVLTIEDFDVLKNLETLKNIFLKFFTAYEQAEAVL